jgi:hypothetical protein
MVAMDPVGNSPAQLVGGNVDGVGEAADIGVAASVDPISTAAASDALTPTALDDLDGELHAPG